MQRIRLIEYQRSAPVCLTHEQIMAIGRVVPDMRVEAAPNEAGAYVLAPGSHVGVVVLPDVTLEIRPKIPMDRLFFLISHAMAPGMWRDEEIELDADASVLEAVAPVFVRLVARATYRGLLHGYKTHEEASVVVRGRLRIDDQIRQRAGMMFPAEVRYDEFTDDILENQLLLAAMELLMRLPLRSAQTGRSLRELRSAFHAVTPQTFSSSCLPTVGFTRLNEHYRPAIGLALLILKGGSLELGSGRTTGISLLLDMNDLFERFVHRALREALGLDEQTFPRGRSGLALDEDRHVQLLPDLSWWRGGRCRFVGDVKYKRVNAQGIKHPDLYQLLAYTVAANLECGLLIYAAGEGEPAQHTIPSVHKTLHVETLNLAGPIDVIRGQIDRLAERVRALGDASDSLRDQLCDAPALVPPAGS